MSELLPQDANENSLWGASAIASPPDGYNGRGISIGTALGKYLADTVASGNSDDFPFPIESLFREKWAALRSAFYDYGMLALQFVDNRW